jgi:hypothetical protein
MNMIGRRPPSPTFVSKRHSVWTRRSALTTVVLTSAILLHATTLRAPQWATGQTYHLASSSAFQVDLSVGLWGYCATAKSVDAAASIGESEKENCVAFHSTIGHQELSVCEAFARGFVYGTDDVRGVRFPATASEDVHRIPRPPTSLDDVHIQRFIEKSCGVDGATTITLSWASIFMASWTLVAFLWTLGKPLPLLHELRTPAQSNSTMMQCASLASFMAVLVWLHQTSDLRRTGDTRERVSIEVGHAVYMQLGVALLYCLAGVGVLATDAEHAHRRRPILKL